MTSMVSMWGAVIWQNEIDWQFCDPRIVTGYLSNGYKEQYTFNLCVVMFQVC